MIYDWATTSHFSHIFRVTGFVRGIHRSPTSDAFDVFFDLRLEKSVE